MPLPFLPAVLLALLLLPALTGASGAEACPRGLAGFDCAGAADLPDEQAISAPGLIARSGRQMAGLTMARPLLPGGRPVTYSVEVQHGTGLEARAIARQIGAILSDPRGWQASGRWSFRRVTPDQARVRFVIAGPAQVDRMCRPLRTLDYLSCRQGRFVVMNALRWQGAMPHWDGTVESYRAYLVNHELGHALGHGHAACPGLGARAPVMMQQTKSLRGCRSNGWPHPERRAVAAGLSGLRLQ